MFSDKIMHLAPEATDIAQLTQARKRLRELIRNGAEMSASLGSPSSAPRTRATPVLCCVRPTSLRRCKLRGTQGIGGLPARAAAGGPYARATHSDRGALVSGAAAALTTHTPAPI